MSKNDEPPDKFPLWIKVVWVLTFLLLLIALALCILALIEKEKPGEKNPPVSVEEPIIVQGNSILAQSAHFIPPMVVRAIVTAYNPVPEQTDDTPHITASGERVREGIVANNCLPFGTIVEIGGRSYVVLDRMNRRYGCHYFDILMFSYREAIQWGVRKMQVKIYH